MKRNFVLLLIAISVACGKPAPLTRELANQIISSQLPKREPTYAEVPQRVWFGPKSPKDEYDGKSIETMQALQKAGLITVTESATPDGMTTYQAKVTQAGFNILGTMPSARGAVYRGLICWKINDGVRNFVRHPHYPTVGQAEVTWHYAEPTNLYPMFTTRINKPLNKPFATVIAIHNEKGAWKCEVTVKKIEGR